MSVGDIFTNIADIVDLELCSDVDSVGTDHMCFSCPESQVSGQLTQHRDGWASHFPSCPSSRVQSHHCIYAPEWRRQRRHG